MGTANGHQVILAAAPGQRRTAAVPSPRHLSRTRNTHPPIPTADPPEWQRTPQASPPHLHREPVPPTATANLIMTGTRRAEISHLPVPPVAEVAAAAVGVASLVAPTPPGATPPTIAFFASSPLVLTPLPLPLMPFPWRKSTRRAPGSRTENRAFLRGEGAASRGGGATAMTAMVTVVVAVVRAGANHRCVRGCSNWAIDSRGELCSTAAGSF